MYHAHAARKEIPALKTSVTVGSRFGDWRVCWLGGWSRHQLSYIVMVVRGVDPAEHIAPQRPNTKDDKKAPPGKYWRR
jgi:hypothetical protein